MARPVETFTVILGPWARDLVGLLIQLLVKPISGSICRVISNIEGRCRERGFRRPVRLEYPRTYRNDSVLVLA